MKSIFKTMADTISPGGGGDILIVTHAFTIKTLIFIFAKHRLNEVTNIENASITKIVYENGNFYISDINNTQYIG
ncbi:Predicted phosphoglycerate mutase [Clostridium kluyveri DSM 555]|uniref:Predicted phosphoglycerate mutase n=1 Tax=Clostridium kluyveri (strain ATCC 8527 / DSM 555 / NBRC 12016 / NCIMB 10680 / K1) TaxID=431943 RepID=A5N8U9_CLOK5|nr:Predicted phosphoglycerate mutase [Clostridium kluyveri DSM 555]